MSGLLSSSTKPNEGGNNINQVGGTLVGLRPFLNVHSLAITDTCLALMASNEYE